MAGRITPELDEKILEMYQHRINLILEAEEYTIHKISERLGVGTTTVWARTNGLEMTKKEDTYVQRMEDELAKIKRALANTKQGLSEIMVILRKVTRDANKKHDEASRIFTAAGAEVSPIIVSLEKVLNR
jgi:DNA-binding Lrp family transcriptional regulator